MFARVITAEAESDQIDDFLDFTRRQLSTAHQFPGFAGYYVLTDSETGAVVVMSLWGSREEMEAVAEGQPNGIRHEDASAAVLKGMRLRTYEVALSG